MTRRQHKRRTAAAMRAWVADAPRGRAWVPMSWYGRRHPRQMALGRAWGGHLGACESFQFIASPLLQPRA